MTTIKDILADKNGEINKNTNNDKRSILSQAINKTFRSIHDDMDYYHYFYLVDFDDDYVYFEYYDCGCSNYRTWKVPYTFNGTSASLDGEDVVEVVRLTEYREIEESSDESITKSTLFGWLDKYFGGTKQESQNIIKQFDEEEMISIEPLYIGVDEVDGHGWTFESPDVITEMVDSFNKAVDEGRLQSGLFHKHATQGFKANRAWVNPCDCTVGETFVKKGDPLVEIQYTNKSLWEKRKAGEISGPSIGAKGDWVSIDE